MRLIGSWCKHGDVFSLRVLIGRGLDLLNRGKSELYWLSLVMCFERHEARVIACGAWVLGSRFTDCLVMVMFFSSYIIFFIRFAGFDYLCTISSVGRATDS